MVVFKAPAILLSVPRIVPSAVVIARTVPICVLSQRSGERSRSHSKLRGAGDIETESLRRQYCRGTREDRKHNRCSRRHIIAVPARVRWRWCPSPAVGDGQVEMVSDSHVAHGWSSHAYHEGPGTTNGGGSGCEGHLMHEAWDSL
jgi:hypothetical protein